jgi:hypothetical protein
MHILLRIIEYPDHHPLITGLAFIFTIALIILILSKKRFFKSIKNNQTNESLMDKDVLGMDKTGNDKYLELSPTKGKFNWPLVLLISLFVIGLTLIYVDSITSRVKSSNPPNETWSPSEIKPAE